MTSSKPLCIPAICFLCTGPQLLAEASVLMVRIFLITRGYTVNFESRVSRVSVLSDYLLV